MHPTNKFGGLSQPYASERCEVQTNPVGKSTRFSLRRQNIKGHDDATLNAGHAYVAIFSTSAFAQIFTPTTVLSLLKSYHFSMRFSTAF